MTTRQKLISARQQREAGELADARRLELETMDELLAREYAAVDSMQKGFTIPVHDHGFVRYIDHMGTDLDIVESARISYQSPSKGDDRDKKLLRYLLVNRHTSPFEMCKVKFNIKMPIFVMRQFVRHRMQNLNEVSARYTELPQEFHVPSAWRKQDTKNKQSSVADVDWDACNYHENLSAELRIAYDHAYSTYRRLLLKGVAREQARIVLPVGIYTEVYSCWDLNNLLKFFSLRDDPHAQGEHQDYARAMKEITRNLFPWTMEIYDEMKQWEAERANERKANA